MPNQRLASIANKFLLLLAFLFIVLGGAYLPLINLSQPLEYDWNLFTTLSLVARSSILFFHTLPLHDPWVGGGVDLLANPQTRIFSPNFLFDLIFPPYLANWIVVLLYGFFGAVGMYVLLRKKNISRISAWIGATVFLNSNYFGLHFGEGHVAFAGLQMLPWVYYFLLNLERPAAWFFLISLLGFLLLDGNCYPSVLTSVFVAAYFIFHPREFRHLLVRTNRLVALASIVSFFLILSVKTVPAFFSHGHTVPHIYSTNVAFSEYAQVFFNPFQSSRVYLQETNVGILRFHEFGCYFSVLGVILMIGYFAFHPRHFRLWPRTVLLTFFFLWTGLGLGGGFNPWTAFQSLPIFNFAHIQSRMFVFSHFLFTLMLIWVVDQFRNSPKFYYVLITFFLLESLVVKNFPFLDGLRYLERIASVDIIVGNHIDETVAKTENSLRPQLYANGTRSARLVMEPFLPDTSVSAVGEPGYRGQFYLVDGSGTVTQKSVSPGKIEFLYESSTPATVEINTNFLAGWKITAGIGEIRRNPRTLIQVKVPAGRGEISLQYDPVYFNGMITAFLAGLVLWMMIFFKWVWPGLQINLFERSLVA